MINRSKLDRLIAEKKARNRACHVIGFIIAIVYIFLYEIWWTRIPAYNDLIYKLGILSSTLSYSIVASYIFHYIITVIPEKKKRKEMSFALQYHHEILIDILSDLMVAVLKEDNWKSKDVHELQKEYREKSKTRKIRSEKCHGMIEDEHATTYIEPDTLFIISRLLERLDDTFSNIMELAYYIENIDYLENILNLSESKTLAKLGICREAVKNEEKVEGNTYLDYIFRVELPEYIFDEKLGIFQTVKNLTMWDKI